MSPEIGSAAASGGFPLGWTDLIDLTRTAVTALLSRDLVYEIMIALGSAGLGAYFGARGAQRVSEDQIERSERLKEINNTNAAITVGFAMLNNYFAFKNQFLDPMIVNYGQQVEKLKEHKSKKVAVIFEYQLDLKSFPEVYVHESQFERLVFTELSLTAKPMHACLMYIQISRELNRTIRLRDSLVNSIRIDKTLSDKQRSQIYFAIPDGDGNYDSRYFDLITGMSKYTEDCLFFLSLIIRELERHGNELSMDYRRRFKSGSPKIHSVNLDSDDIKAMLPDQNLYAGWLKAYPNK